MQSCKMVIKQKYPADQTNDTPYVYLKTIQEMFFTNWLCHCLKGTKSNMCVSQCLIFKIFPLRIHLAKY